MNVDSRGKENSNSGDPNIGYDNRVGAPEGVPRDFVPLIIAFPDRVYGVWWYILEDGTVSAPQGWYIWIESQKLLGITRGRKVRWHHATHFESSLTAAIASLR